MGFVLPVKHIGEDKKESRSLSKVLNGNHIPYARHYNLQFVYLLPHCIVHSGLYCRAVSVTDDLCTKQGQGNSSIFGSKIRGFKSRAGYSAASMVPKSF